MKCCYCESWGMCFDAKPYFNQCKSVCPLEEKRGTGMMTGNILEDIKTIVTECEEYQHSKESSYSKEHEIICAYELIRELITPREDKQ